MHTVFAAGNVVEGADGTGAQAVAEGTGAQAAVAESAAATVRVAIAGATGYTGQELLRLLARHPAVTIAAATSSGAQSAARRLPALAHLWNGAITPLAAE